MCAFAVMLLFRIPFLLVVLTPVFGKACVNASPNDMSAVRVGRLRRGLGVAAIDVTVDAQSRSQDMSSRVFDGRRRPGFRALVQA
jgi:hypothetical protein